MSTPAIFRNLHGKVPPEVEHALRLLFNGMKDSHDAIVALKGQHDSTSSQVKTVSSQVATTQQSVNQVAASIPAAVGSVNLLAPASLEQTSYGALVPITSAALTLNSNVSPPYFAFVQNNGGGDATLTPTSGTVNGSATGSISAGSLATVFFDGTNWWVAEGGGGGEITYLQLDGGHAATTYSSDTFRFDMGGAS